MDRLLPGVIKTSAEKAILKERIWLAGLKRGKRATWWSFGVKHYELGQCFARHESQNTDEWVYVYARLPQFEFRVKFPLHAALPLAAVL